MVRFIKPNLFVFIHSEFTPRYKLGVKIPLIYTLILHQASETNPLVSVCGEVINYSINFKKMENVNILERLTIIENLLKEQNRLQKEALSFNEACEYLEISHSHLYKLTSTDTIPHYKPNGKKIYFKRTEIDNWLLSNRSASTSEIEQQAANYLLKKGRVKL